MCKATHDGLITPRRDRATRLRLSLYADDAVIFINPVKEDFGMIMALMLCFNDATRLRINVNKSSVTPIHYSQVNLDEVL
jgi:phosphotransferase system IIB component